LTEISEDDASSVRQILYLGPPDFTDLIRDELGTGYQVVWAPSEKEAVEPLIARTAVWFDASMKIPLDAVLLDRAGNLELVITATTGSDHIELSPLQRRGIPLMTMQGQTDCLRELTPAAELSWLLLLACARKLRAAIHHVEHGGWNRELFPGLMLKGRTLGIIGCGRIGGWMARYGHAFGMTVYGYDPFLKNLPAGIAPLPLETLLESSDAVSVHVPFNESTRGLLGEDELGRLREGAILINTSRGAIVDGEALLKGLEKGRPGALGVDVIEGEPNIEESALWRYAQTHENVVITPHIGGFSPDALQTVLRYTAGRVRDHFRGLDRV
jgi:phosphoglycerate dehydrogenase-like enzyme